MDGKQPLARASIQIARITGLGEGCWSDIKDGLAPQPPATVGRGLRLVYDKRLAIPLDGDVSERAFHIAHVRIVAVALHAMKVFGLAVPPYDS
jgi:hypothetical protein